MALITTYRPRTPSGWLLAALIVATGLTAGCGGSDTSVARLSGTVTLDGEPLPDGSIASVSFQPVAGASGKPTSAQITESRYDCPDVPQGTVLATLNLSVPTGRTIRSERTGQSTSELENVVLEPDQRDGIELTVSDDTTVDFDLQRAKRSTPAGKKP